MSNQERTLSIIKPDAVERNLVEKIKDVFLKNNFSILEIKKLHITKDEAAEFYKVHQSKSLYLSIIWANSSNDFRKRRCSSKK